MRTRKARRQIHIAQMKSILDFMGHSINTLPKTTKEINEMYETLQTINPVEFQNAYDIIYHHKIPEAGVSEELLLEKVGKVIDSESYDKVQKHLELLNHVTGDIADQLEKRAKLAFSEAKRDATEKMRTIQIKIGNSKPRKVNGVIPEYFEKLLRKAQARRNLMLVGPAGSGKTHIAGMLAEALGLDHASQSCTAGMSESALSGWLLPTGDAGKFEYVQSEFVRIYENGGVFLFDEMDAADPNVLIFINQAIANGKFSLPIRHKNPTVVRHPDFIAIAATNTFGGGADAMYHARNALDAATLDRFKSGMMVVDYSDVVEEKLVDADILEWGREVRSIIKNHKLKRLMSTRVMIDFTILKNEQDFTLEELKSDFFLDWSPEEKRIASV